MRSRPVRLEPGDDLRRSLEALCRDHFPDGAFVVCGIGSLDSPRLRFAATDGETVVDGPCELVTLSGSVTLDGAHLHMTVASGDGAVLGGHVAYGNAVRTTVEALLCEPAGWTLHRVQDHRTGYLELACRPRRDPGADAEPDAARRA